MKKKLLKFLLALCPLTAFAAAPVIWESSDYGRWLVNKGFKLVDDKEFRTISVDPSAGAGVSAAVGSIAVRSNSGVGEGWFKIGSANTAWTNFLTGATGWGLFGNAGTTAGTNFLGTTDAVDLVFKTNNIEVLRLTSGGSIDSTLGTGLIHSNSSGIFSSSTLVDADVSSSAAITRSKLANGTAYRILANDASGVIAENAAITASHAVASDANGQLVASSSTATQLGYLASATQATADATHTGLLSGTNWSTFNSKQAALTPGTISTSTTGITVGSGTNSTVGPSVTVDVQTASGSQPGLLSAADWTTFNGKQAAGNYITAFTGDVASSAFSAGSVTATIGANKVLDTMIRQSAGLSVIGRSANTTGNVADIAAATDGNVLRRNGTSIGFGSLDLTAAGTVGSSILGHANGGTDVAAAGTAGNVLTSNGTSWASSAPSGATPTIFGSRGTPRSVVAATGITSGASHMSASAISQDIYVSGSISGDSIAATITAGTIDGQRMTIVGRDDTQTVTLDGTTSNFGNNNGPMTLGANSIIALRWDTSAWVEITRSN